MAGRVNAAEPSMAEEIANRDEARMIASILDGDVQLSCDAWQFSMVDCSRIELLDGCLVVLRRKVRVPDGH